MPSTVVIDLGGSLVAPDGVDEAFVRDFIATITGLVESRGTRFAIVVGGGAVARRYQQSLREVVDSPDDAGLDWVGVAATRLNAELIRHAFGSLCSDPVATDPTAVDDISGTVLIGAGWKPGFSTDYDAVVISGQLGARLVIRATNTPGVYTSDPASDPSARLIERMTWAQLIEMVGSKWTPGASLPFDPEATREAQRLGIDAVVADGRDLENLKAIVEKRPFTGTLIGAEV